ncbi:MAG: MFS transporter [Pseudomonadota bacterium]
MTSITESPDSGAVHASASETSPIRTYIGVVAFMASFAVPMSFFYFIFPPMLRTFGHEPEIVGAFAIVYLPYVLRGLWAFAIERAMKGIAARYRLATFWLSVVGVVLVLALLTVDPARQVGAAMAIAVVIFVVFSSGMTTLDGYLLTTLSAKDRAKSAAWTAFGIAFGGITVGFLAWFDVFSVSWSSAILILASASGLSALLILILPKAPGVVMPPQDESSPDAGKFRQFFVAGPFRSLVLIAILAHGTTGLLSGYLPVLQIDAGLSIGDIGLFSAIGSNVMGIAGALLGGWILARIGGWRTLAVVTAGLAIILAGAAALHESLWGEKFAIGITIILMMVGYTYFVPYRALMLEACEGPGSVSRVAILSSFDMTTGIVAMSLAGVVAVQLGLTLFFAMGTGLAFLAALYALSVARASGR